ncbi:response regulator transcription factor [Aquirufa salirivi]|uniref:LuxR C-terminal-related transcriptional regulator n=1 Tax=Aquirufa salirivi TaxID=3104729 RepID=A0ABW8RZK0_9BACT
MNPKLDPTNFTLREIEIILLIKKGLSSHEIAAHLNLSFFTIKKHRENILQKIGWKGKMEFRKFILQFTYADQN